MSERKMGQLMKTNMDLKKKKSFKNYSEAWEKGKQVQSTIGKSSSETGAFPERKRLDVNYTNKWILA